MDININPCISKKFSFATTSNASDALDKIRFLSLSGICILGEGENKKLEIKTFDKEKRTLTFDRGGDDQARLDSNLGTVARLEPPSSSKRLHQAKTPTLLDSLLVYRIFGCWQDPSHHKQQMTNNTSGKVLPTLRSVWLPIH